MEYVLFTVVAIAIYFVSDRVLDQAETMAGRRFKNRSVIFFVIMAAFALVTFKVINWVLAL